MSEKLAESKQKRLQKIIHVFFKYRVIQNLSKQENPDQVRTAFEVLGPTFIKIGQLLSVRTDLLSPTFLDAFKSLQDNVKSDDYESVKALVEKELQQPLTNVFTSFAQTPIASASIGQAHLATLHSGEEVIVKVQHPGTIEAIQTDLALFEKALPLIRYIPESNVVDLKNVLKELRRSLDDETDFLKETKNAQEFYKKNHHWEQVVVPKVYTDYCTTKIIVLEFMKGQSIRYLLTQKDDYPTAFSGTAKQLKVAIGTLLIKSFMKQVFEDGFFHADPHPGNLFYQELPPTEKTHPVFHIKEKNGVIGGIDYSLKWKDTGVSADYHLVFLDFGMMGHLDEHMRKLLTDALISLYTQDTQKVGKAVLRLCQQEGPFDEHSFYKELQLFVEDYYNRPIKDIDLQDVLQQVITICHNHNLQVNRQITMLVKAFATLEGVVEALDPTLSLMEVTQTFAEKYFFQQLNWGEELKKSSLDVAKSLRALLKLPDHTLTLLDTLTAGKGQIKLTYGQQDQLLDRVDKMVNRLAVSLLLAAVILGSSLLIVARPEPNDFIHRLGILGYVITFVIIFCAVFRYLYDKLKKRK